MCGEFDTICEAANVIIVSKEEVSSPLYLCIIGPPTHTADVLVSVHCVVVKVNSACNDKRTPLRHLPQPKFLSPVVMHVCIFSLRLITLAPRDPTLLSAGRISSPQCCNNLLETESSYCTLHSPHSHISQSFVPHLTKP